MRGFKYLASLLLIAGVAFFAGIAQADPIEKAVLVVDDAHTFAFVGWYGTYEFPTTQGQAWAILMNTVQWAVGSGQPSAKNILLFTADGTFNPDNAGNLDAGTLYNRLTGEGYNVTVANQTAITTMTNYSPYNLVIYPNLDDHSAANVVAAGVPFITMEPGQTDEMSIGTGVSVFNGLAQNFIVDDNTHPASADLGLGGLVFDNAVRTEAITAASNGHVLIGEQVPEPATVMMVLSGISGLAWLRRRRDA